MERLELRERTVICSKTHWCAQVRYALKDVDGQFDVHKSQARIYVDCEGDYDYDETVEHLKKVFGLVGICPGCPYGGQRIRGTEKRCCRIYG